MFHLPWCREQHCAGSSQLEQSPDQGRVEEDPRWTAELEEVEAETGLGIPLPVVGPGVDSDEEGGLPVDPVVGLAEVEELQRDRQDNRRRGQRGT